MHSGESKSWWWLAALLLPFFAVGAYFAQSEPPSSSCWGAIAGATLASASAAISIRKRECHCRIALVAAIASVLFAGFAIVAGIPVS